MTVQPRHRVRIATLAAGIAVLAFLPAGVQAARAAMPSPAAAGIASGCTWVINELPTPAGLDPVHAPKADSETSFAGYGFDASRLQHAVVWRAGQPVVLASPAGQGATATDVNSAGDAVGHSVMDMSAPVPLETSPGEKSTPIQALLWRQDRLTKLAMPRGADHAWAIAINDSGLIAGYASFGGTSRAVTWSASAPGRVRDLGAVEGVVGSVYVTDLTETGVIVGWVDTADGTTAHAVAGTADQGLHVLPGLTPDVRSSAQAAAGPYIVGQGQLADRSNGEYGGGLRWDHGTPSPLPDGFAGYGVNSSGIVVGINGTLGAGVWIDGQVQALPVLAGAYPNDSAPTDVTDAGTIVGMSTDADGHIRPVTWTCR
jgi:uncharacterized membrane protein